MQDQIFDYAQHLIAIDRLAKELHEACLYKRYDDVPTMVNDLIVEARMVRAWATDKMEKAYGE